MQGKRKRKRVPRKCEKGEVEKERRRGWGREGEGREVEVRGRKEDRGGGHDS